MLYRVTIAGPMYGDGTASAQSFAVAADTPDDAIAKANKTIAFAPSFAKCEEVPDGVVPMKQEQVFPANDKAFKPAVASNGATVPPAVIEGTVPGVQTTDRVKQPSRNIPPATPDIPLSE